MCKEWNFIQLNVGYNHPDNYHHHESVWSGSAATALNIIVMIHHYQIFKYFPPPVIMKSELARLAARADHQTRAHQDHAGGPALNMIVKLLILEH